MDLPLFDLCPGAAIQIDVISAVQYILEEGAIIRLTTHVEGVLSRLRYLGQVAVMLVAAREARNADVSASEQLLRRLLTVRLYTGQEAGGSSVVFSRHRVRGSSFTDLALI